MSESRRKFLQGSSSVIAGSLVASGSLQGKESPAERVTVGVMGGGGRASSLIHSFAGNSAVDVAAVADLDPNRLQNGLRIAQERQGRRPRAEKDFRKLIDDSSIDAIVVGTPDHWHAIPTILACQAGKDVYVEKPDAHDIVEGQRMVAAMRKHKRVVQMGSQHRSTKRLQSAIEFVETGALGRCVVAKAWESSRQGNIGFPQDGSPPAGVDYDMWIGPARKRPFNRNRFHGRWRWFYDFGTGDLGNDGVHRLDMAVALLNAACRAQKHEEVGLPRLISAYGGKWYFDDAQEFPDTMQVSYQFGSGHQTKMLTYEMRVWAPYSYLGHSEGSAVFGDKGHIIIGNSSWVAYGARGKVLAQGEGDSHEAPHVQNFIECIKTRNRPHCDLETVGHPASVLCHAGNIAARLSRTVELNPDDETFENDDEANALRGRTEYRRPWVLPEV